MEFDIRLACKRPERTVPSQKSPKFVAPGDTITADVGFMRGHGTYLDDDNLVASVAGVVERVNRLVSVLPFKTRYNGEIGDVVVGRIVEVQQKRWKVDTNSRLNSVLMLSSVNLPGGELRRRGVEDELMMRHYLQEGDLVSAEVQAVFTDGVLSLHTRSLKYGKLSQGTLLRVTPSLVKRCKTHFHNLPCGAHVILGNNGFVFVGPIAAEESEGSTSGDGGFIQNLEPVADDDRKAIARVRNCIYALAQEKTLLYDTVILYAYEASLRYQIRDLLKPEVMQEIADLAKERIAMECNE